MPNHVRNELSFIGTEDNVREVLEFITSKDGKRAIDFNRIVPRPATIGIERSSRVADGIKLAKKLKLDTMDREMINSIVTQFGTDVAKNIRLGRIALYNLEKYGCQDWYDWSYDNWGTKWNAYDIEDEFDVIYFNTAWCGVPDLMCKLSEMFPQVTISYMYADEDTGCNVGAYEFNGGKATMRCEPDNCTDEAYELAFELRPWLRDMYEYRNGKYEFVGWD